MPSTYSQVRHDAAYVRLRSLTAAVAGGEKGIRGCDTLRGFRFAQTHSCARQSRDNFGRFAPSPSPSARALITLAELAGASPARLPAARCPRSDTAPLSPRLPPGGATHLGHPRRAVARSLATFMWRCLHTPQYRPSAVHPVPGERGTPPDAAGRLHTDADLFGASVFRHPAPSGVWPHGCAAEPYCSQEDGGL